MFGRAVGHLVVADARSETASWLRSRLRWHAERSARSARSTISTWPRASTYWGPPNKPLQRTNHGGYAAAGRTSNGGCAGPTND